VAARAKLDDADRSSAIDPEMSVAQSTPLSKEEPPAAMKGGEMRLEVKARDAAPVELAPPADGFHESQAAKPALPPAVPRVEAPASAPAAHMRGGRAGPSAFSVDEGAVVADERESNLDRVREDLARGERRAAAARLDSLLAAAGPGAPSREARREMADLYARLAREETDPALAAPWAERAIALTATLQAESASAADCRLLAARIREFVDRFPADARADSLARAGEGLSCEP
jgi:hypothetical protein